MILSRKAGVYAIRNTVTGRMYIGSAVNLADRLDKHKRALNAKFHKNRHLQNAWNKDGPESFAANIVCVCAKTDLLYFEQRAFNAYGHDRLYNVCLVAGSRFGTIMDDTARTALAMRMMGNRYTAGRSLTPEHRARISAGLVGKVVRKGYSLSAETKAKLSAASRGNKYAAGTYRSPESNAARRAALIGRPCPQERKARISASLQCHRVSDITRRKISEALRGRKCPAVSEANRWRRQITLGQFGRSRVNGPARKGQPCINTHGISVTS